MANNSQKFVPRRPPRFIPPLGPPRPSAKERVLAQWHGADSSPQQKIRERPPKSVDAVMPKVLTTLRMDSRRAEAEIVRVWNNLIAPDVIAHAQPTGLNTKGTLFVTVDSNVWLDEIVRYRRKEILDRLQHSFGSNLIARISFRIG